MANQIFAEESSFQNLAGKVVVLTGGASGIGKETVTYLVHAGAHVVFGDFDQAAGAAVAQHFANQPNSPDFVPTDVSKYADNVQLFKSALQRHGRVDHAVACAGIIEQGKWFDPDLTIDSVEQPETSAVIDVNLLGVLYFTRIAVVYLRHARTPGDDRSIVLVSSAAGFWDSPGLFMYQIRHERDGIRVNAVCPAMTDSAMTAGIIASYREKNFAINTAQDVAKYIVGLQLDTRLTGKAMYVVGGQSWEFMDGLDASMSTWLGAEPTKTLRKHLHHVGQGSVWKIE